MPNLLFVISRAKRGAELIAGIPITGSVNLVDVEYAQKLLEEDIFAQTDEDMEYVEGRWEDEKHKAIISTAAKEYGGLSSAEIKILKVGAAYPDYPSSRCT